MQIKPKTGIKGLTENWQSDLIAAISVALIALPLSLGIALAAGAPAMSGIFSAVVGGIVTTLYRGGHISVNGPAKGVIGVILLGIALMDDGSGQAFNYVLAAVVVSGAIQMLLGILKLGRLAEVFHSSVIHGILAAIGIIIFAKQIHVALGTHSDSPSIIQNLIDAVLYLPQANPFVILISLTGLFLLLLHSKISYRFFHFLPAPMWVIALSIPFAYLFNFFDQQTLSFLGKTYEIGPHLLLDIPDNIMDSIMHPNFNKVNTIEFWTTVFSMLIITSIESLAIAKAVDKIDPYKRKTDLNKDLTGIGLSTMVAGLIGGLPIIAVIIRSTVNIHNGAKTKWSNMYQGILLLLFIVALSPIMRKVPLSAFAYLFNFFDQQTLSFLGKTYEIGPHLLLDIPDNIMDSIMHPNFNKVNTIEFWTTVFSMLIITSIESLAIAKAVDKIDPYKRKTDLNKDLTGIGLSTMVAGLIGGLPIIAVIIRSTVNIHNGAKTKWSNMYQGILLLLFIVALSPIMRKVPLSAFAILLVYTGFKLASPAVFKKAYNQGTEQLIFFTGTMILTIYTNLLIGLLGGLLLALDYSYAFSKIIHSSIF